MSDLIVLLMTLAFFGVCLGYVRWCDRIIGSDEELGTTSAADEPSTVELEAVA